MTTLVLRLVAAGILGLGVDPAYVAAGAIPWLLLEVVGAKAGPTGARTFFSLRFHQSIRKDS